MREIYTADQPLTPADVHLARRDDRAIDLRIGALSLATALPSEGAADIAAARDVYARIATVAKHAADLCDQQLYARRLAQETATHTPPAPGLPCPDQPGDQRVATAGADGTAEPIVTAEVSR